MRIQPKTRYIALGAVVVAGVTLVTAPLLARAHQERPGHRFGMHLGDRLASLNVTAEQRTQIREIWRQNQPQIEPVARQVVTERRTLREVIRAPQVDEAAIRAQSAKVAAAEADLAVARARVAQQIRGVLTEDQIQKLKDWQADVYDRIDMALERMRHRLAE